MASNVSAISGRIVGVTKRPKLNALVFNLDNGNRVTTLKGADGRYYDVLGKKIRVSIGAALCRLEVDHD